MNRVVVVGASGQAKVALDILQQQSDIQVVGLLDPSKKKGELFFQHKVLGDVDDLPSLIEKQTIQSAFVAIGDNFVRSQVVQQITSQVPQLSFVSAIHPRAIISPSATIGQGAIVMAGACVNPDTQVGTFCIVNTGASLDHDSCMENYASLAPGVHTGGNCHIAEFSAIGMGSTLIHQITVGAHSVVGAGSVVVKDIPSHVVAYGCPAQVVRKRQEGEKYL